MDGEISISFISASGGRIYNPGDEMSHTMIALSKQYEEFQEGLHSIRCECKIVQPNVTDTNPSNNVLTGTLRVGEKP